MPLINSSIGQEVYKDPPNTLPLYSRKEKLKDQVFFDTWKPLLKDIQAIQETTKKHAKGYGIVHMILLKNLEWK
jgi:hypothetical protein